MRPAPDSDRGSVHRSERAAARLRQRYAAERRFRLYGIAAVGIALTMLIVLLGSIILKGAPAFLQTHIQLTVVLDETEIDPTGERSVDVLGRANYQGLVNDALYALFPEVEGRTDRRALRDMVSNGAGYELRQRVLDDPGLVGQTLTLWVPASDDIDQLQKGHIDATVDSSRRRVNDAQIGWYRALDDQGLVDARFNTRLFTNSDSREPELAGIWGATVGSFYTLLVTLAISFPIGVSAAIYLEEFAPKNRWTDLIEVNINNLAAVPSIVFGLLGLAVFIQIFGLPRSAPLVGGLVLALMTLPTIIIASRAALKAVPPSIREAGLGMGASKLQVVGHHVLPLAMPGILTGTIIGMAQALGETAPLLMIGMVAFVIDSPTGLTDPSTVLPVQIYLWSDSPERAFVERTSAAIMVLLTFLILMNALAVFLRKRFERRW
ncbi:MAG: phosphate ABC transporter permease PstA [Inquilinaceae bacterium]